MAVRAATAGSEHPVPAQAVAECAGALLDAHVHAPDLLWVFAGVPFAGALLDISETLTSLLSGSSVVAVVSEGVVMGGRVSRGGPALGVLALECPSVRSFWLPPGELLADAAPVAESSTDSVVMVAADPFSVQPAGVRAGPRDPIRIVGGNLAAGPVVGASRIVVDGHEHRDGAAVSVLPPGAARGFVAHGTAAVAAPMVVSSVRATTLVALDDLPAAEAFELAIATAGAELMSGATEVGLRRVGRRELVGVRRSPGGLEVTEALATGELVEPAVRSAAVAGAELTELLGGSGRSSAPGGAGVCFLDLARPGAAVAGGDAAVVAERFGSQDVGLLVGGVHCGAARPSSVLRGVAGLVVFGG